MREVALNFDALRVPVRSFEKKVDKRSAVFFLITFWAV